MQLETCVHNRSASDGAYNRPTLPKKKPKAEQSRTREAAFFSDFFNDPNKIGYRDARRLSDW